MPHGIDPRCSRRCANHRPSCPLLLPALLLALPSFLVEAAPARGTGIPRVRSRRLRLPPWHERPFTHTERNYEDIAWAPGGEDCWWDQPPELSLTFEHCCNESLPGGLGSCWSSGTGLSFRACCSAASLPPSDLPRHRRAVATLSTTPYRVNELWLVIKSLAQQTYALDAIYLSIPLLFARDWSWYDVPWEYAELTDRLRINRCEQDYRPQTGLLCALQHEPDPSTYILVVDDDMVYHPTLVDRLLRHSLRQPGAMIGAMAYTSAGAVCRRRDSHGTCVVPNLVHSTFGILFQRRFFDAGIFNYAAAAKAYANLRPDLPSSDDYVATCCMIQGNLWYESHLSRKAIPRVFLRDKMGSRMISDLAYGHGALFSFHHDVFWYYHNNDDAQSIQEAEEVCLRALSALWGPTLWAARPRRVAAVDLPSIARGGDASSAVWADGEAGAVADALRGLAWLDFHGAVLFACSGRSMEEWRTSLRSRKALVMQVAFLHVFFGGTFTSEPAEPAAFRPGKLESVDWPPRFLIPKNLPEFDKAGLLRPLAEVVELCGAPSVEVFVAPEAEVCIAQTTSPWHRSCEEGRPIIADLEARGLAAVKCCASAGAVYSCIHAATPRNSSWLQQDFANCLPRLATYWDASRICAATNLRLCDASEILDCCGLGCEGQSDVWIQSLAAASCAEHAPRASWRSVPTPRPRWPGELPLEKRKQLFLELHEEAPSTIVEWVVL